MMALTGIPPYTDALPIEYSLRCSWARRYVVFTGSKMIGDVKARAKERATIMGATFVNARTTPFMQCECGQALDFAPDDSMMVN
jgi:hypothetical protein